MPGLKSSIFMFILAIVLLVAEVTRGQVVYAPATPQVSASTDVVGFILQNPTNQTLPAQHIIFAHPFSVGQLKTASSSVVLAAVGPSTIAVQVNVKATHSDGSVKHAVLVAKQPTLQAGESQSFMLTTNSASNIGTSVDLENFPSSSVTVSMSISQPSAQSVNVDVSKALSDALAANSASYWLQGPLAAQARVVIQVMSSFRLAFDVTLFSDKSFSVDVQFLNDIAMSNSGDTLVYGVTISSDGQTLYSNSSITHYQYQTWHFVHHSDQTPLVNVQYDVLALIQSNAVHPYNISMGISQTLVSDIEKQMMYDNWGSPLSPNGVQPDMPMTGGRADIGPLSLWAAAWIVSQHDSARRFMLSWGDAAGSTPVNYFGKNQSRWMNVFDYPDMFIDTRCSPYLKCPTQFTKDPVWDLDTSHFPNLAYVPYLITGSRYYLDRMEAVAAWVGVRYYPTARNLGGKTELGLLVNGNQLRGSAWGLREVILSSYISPDDSIMRDYYEKMIFNNLSWLNNQTADWQAKTGDTHGVILSFSYGSFGSGFIIPPWQLDYFVSTLSIAARQGNEMALKYLQWSRNWNVGRFTHSPDFNPKNGVAYNLYYANGTTYFKTWKELQQIQVATGFNSQQFGNGVFNALGLMTLVMYQVSFPEDNEAYTAWQWFMTSGAPDISPQFFRADPTFSMAPYTPRVNPPGSGTAGETPGSANSTPLNATSSATTNYASLAMTTLLVVLCLMQQ